MSTGMHYKLIRRGPRALVRPGTRERRLGQERGATTQAFPFFENPRRENAMEHQMGLGLG